MADIIQIPESAPFSPDQKAWINGYLAGLMAVGALTVPAGTSAQGRALEEGLPRLLILFGSQTGTAEGYAHEVAKTAKSSGFHPSVVNMSDYGSLDLNREKNVLLLISTYGDGDMPDSAQSFWDFLSGTTNLSLPHISFSVLAFGDKNYSQFCQAGKKFDSLLETSGAIRIHPRVDCDVNYEGDALKWLTGVMQIVGKGAPTTQVSVHDVPLTDTDDQAHTSIPQWSKSNPYQSHLLVNRILTAQDSEKETRHYEFNLERSGLTYEAGDALGVIPSNDPVLVDGIISLLKIDPDTLVSTGGGRERKLRDTLISTFDLTKPSSDLISRIAELSGSSELKRLLDNDHTSALKDYLWGRDVLDILESHTVRFESIQDFLSPLRKLQPRLYSISSSQKLHPTSVHLTVATVRYHSHGRHHGGVCSTFMADRAGNSTPVPIFVHSSPGFRPPADADAPMIMVGPGTGIAPFLAFLQDRRAIGAKGSHWLFFGEQHSTTDFFYQDELEKFATDGFLSKLSTAFSRDQAHKVYVQHRMVEEAGELWKWLQEGAYFYVCGDASRMAKDVDVALHEVCEKAGGLSSVQASEYIKKLKMEKRYCRDVY
ncbi:MAG: sulfite reductase subunit alpha [Verrucomicrobiota bacterium]|nr:sulfite reductase subunit alpha [Verrucomicrobiota bacterium]